MTCMSLRVHVDGSEPYPIGEEIWDMSLTEAVAEEADTIASDVGSDQLAEDTAAERSALAESVRAAMAAALQAPGDRYLAPDGVRYSLQAVDHPDTEPPGTSAGKAGSVTVPRSVH
jgi:hypothetical protein